MRRASDLRQKVTELEAKNERLWAAIREANDLLRTTKAIAGRYGNNTNWEGFMTRLDGVLRTQHRLMYPEMHRGLDELAAQTKALQQAAGQDHDAAD